MCGHLPELLYINKKSDAFLAGVTEYSDPREILAPALISQQKKGLHIDEISIFTEISFSKLIYVCFSI